MREQVPRYAVLAPLSAGILFLNACAMPTENKKPNVTASFTKSVNFKLQEAIAFSSTRDNPTGIGPGTAQERVYNAAEIYLMLMKQDGTPDATQSPLRLTDNAAGDGFAALSPDGKWIVFDSNRDRALGEPLQTSDLYVMNVDGHAQRHLIRGSSATWSPDRKNIAYHASASGIYSEATLARRDPGTPTFDSDIFVMKVGDVLENGPITDGPGKNVTNITNDAGPWIDEDADWSPNGQKIVFTRHLGEAGTYFTLNHNNTNAEIWVINPDGTGKQQLTFNNWEERAPAWSSDGTRIAFMCRRGLVIQFQICVIPMNADGTWGVETQLTHTTLPHLGVEWSPDDQYIVTHRAVGVPAQFQLFVLKAEIDAAVITPVETQVTNPPGFNGFADWGVVRDPWRGPPVTHPPTSTLTPTPAPTATSTRSMTPTVIPTTAP